VLISYEGLTRIETYEYLKDALREALLNKHSGIVQKEVKLEDLFSYI